MQPRSAQSPSDWWTAIAHYLVHAHICRLGACDEGAFATSARRGWQLQPSYGFCGDVMDADQPQARVVLDAVLETGQSRCFRARPLPELLFSTQISTTLQWPSSHKAIVPGEETRP